MYQIIGHTLQHFHLAIWLVVVKYQQLPQNKRNNEDSSEPGKLPIIGAHTTTTALYIDSSGVCANNVQFLFVYLCGGGGCHHLID